MTNLSDCPSPLCPQQIALIEASFSCALRGKAVLADRVYERFFALEPEARALFKNSLVEQRAKITRALSFTVRAMSSHEELLRMAEELARLHRFIHLTSPQLQHMADAIVGALQDVLGEDFTPDAKQSWQAAFDLFLPHFLAAQARLEVA